MDDFLGDHVSFVLAKLMVSRRGVLGPIDHCLVLNGCRYFIRSLGSLLTKHGPFFFGTQASLHWHQILDFIRLKVIAFKAKGWLLHDIVDDILEGQTVVSAAQAVSRRRVRVFPALLAATNNAKTSNHTLGYSLVHASCIISGPRYDSTWTHHSLSELW